MATPRWFLAVSPVAGMTTAVRVAAVHGGNAGGAGGLRTEETLSATLACPASSTWTDAGVVCDVGSGAASIGMVDESNAPTEVG